jgi:membrane fusion protein (multidrug efflux system)
MTVRVRLVKKVYRDAVVIPQDAVVEIEEGAVVFLASADSARIRPVRVGTVYGQMALIDSGLVEGESLIVVGNRDLVDGERIEVQP